MHFYALKMFRTGTIIKVVFQSSPQASPDDRQRRAVATLIAAALFFWSTRGSDGGFQSAVAKLTFTLTVFDPPVASALAPIPSRWHRRVGTRTFACCTLDILP